MALCHNLIWCYVRVLTLKKPHVPASFNMYLVINKWLIAVKVSNLAGQYLRWNWTLNIGVLGYIVIVWPKEHSREIRSFPPGTPCICLYVGINVCLCMCMYVFMNVCTYTRMYVSMYVSMYVIMSVCKYVCVYVFYTCIWMYVRTYISMCISTYGCMYL